MLVGSVAESHLAFSSKVRKLHCYNVEALGEMSHEINPGLLGYMGDYTTQLYRDYNKRL